MEYNTVYTCSTCGYECKDYDKMKKHEAAHLGLSVDKMESYKALKSFASYMGAVADKLDNEETRNSYNRAVERVVAFEKESGISA